MNIMLFTILCCFGEAKKNEPPLLNNITRHVLVIQICSSINGREISLAGLLILKLSTVSIVQQLKQHTIISSFILKKKGHRINKNV